MVERLVAAAGGFYGDLDVFFDALLTDVFVEAFGADAGFYTEIFVDGGAGDYAGWLAFCASVWHAGRTLTHGGTKDNAPFETQGKETLRSLSKRREEKA